MNRVAVTACVALGTAGVLAAAMSPARAGTKASSPADERHLVVTLVTPTVNQEVAADLTDQGLNGQITIKFSAYVNPRDIVDYQNVVNSLSSKVEFLDSTFARLGGTPSVRRNVFIFAPLSDTTLLLPQGQYTLNLKSSIRSTRGSLLNEGLADFTTTFSVGTDVYPPVLRKISPVDGQTGINLLQKITATFNEPIDPASLAGNVTVLDGSTNPPSAIPGLNGGTGLTTARGGFDVVFTPDPCFGYPPKTNITFNIQGQSTAAPTAAAMTDVFQNKFKRDNGLQWTADPAITGLFHSPNGSYDDFTGIFTMTFQTKGVKPPPSAPAPGNAQMGLYFLPPFSPCGVQLWYSPGCNGVGAQEAFTTINGLGVLDLRGYVTRYNQGITTAYDRIAVVPNSPVRMGRPGGVAYDPRFIATLAQFGHTYMYVVDERNKVVNVVRTDNLKVIGRFTGFSDPRDVSVSTNTVPNITTLYVTDFGSNQVVAINLEAIAVTFGAQPGSQTPCEAVKDNQNIRANIKVGSGPTEVSADGYLHQRVMVTNSLENSVSLIDPTTNKVLKTLEVGGNPSCCDWVCIRFGLIKIALITNQGGLNDPDGSISLYINSPPLNGGFLGAGQVRDGIEGTLVEGVKNPSHVWGNLQWIDPPPPVATLTSVLPEWWASNTGGTTAIRLRVNVAGVFGLSVSPQTIGTYNLGLNPTCTTLDSIHPNHVLMAAVTGLGSVAITDPDRDLVPFLLRVPGVRRLFNAYTH